jgi:MFS family permease
LPWIGHNRGVDPAGRVKADGSGNGPTVVSGRGPVALRYRDFRNLFTASFVSLIGTQMQQDALTWQLYELTESPFALGLIGLFKAIPLISLALLGGVAADARDRRKMLLVTQTTLLVISSALALSAAGGWTQPWMIYAAVAAAAGVTAFDNPARASLIPNLVPREHLANALSLNILAWQAATVVGPAIAGNLIAWFGVTVVYSIDAVSFIAMLLALATMVTFAIIVFFSRYVSLASMVAAVFAPAYYLIGDGVAWTASGAKTLALIAMGLLLIWRHRENILRLLAGTESKLGQNKK